MGQQEYGNISRERFEEWLENESADILTSLRTNGRIYLLKIQNSAGFFYLFGAKTLYGCSDVSLGNSFSICGLYHRQSHALYLAEHPLTEFVDGLTDRERYSITTWSDIISRKVNQHVETAVVNNRDHLSVKELSSEWAIKELCFYKETAAKQDARKAIFSAAEPSLEFRSRYRLNFIREEDLLEYFRAPDEFIQRTAEQYMQTNQEAFLLQFLKNDALSEEYQTLRTQSGVLRQREIAQAVSQLDAKTVRVTIQKDGKELTFQAKTSFLQRCWDSYGILSISSQDRRDFMEQYSPSADYQAEDIVRITFRNKTIYEASSQPEESMDIQEISL